MAISEAIIQEIDFPSELVLNYSMEGLNYILNNDTYIITPEEMIASSRS